MTGVAMMLKSFGLDLSPEGIKKLMADTGIDAKLGEAQGIIKGFVDHVDQRFNKLEECMRLHHECLAGGFRVNDVDANLQRSSHGETHRQLELMNTYLENITYKLSEIHNDILDKTAAGPHSIEGAILIDPLEGFELVGVATDAGTDHTSD